MTTLVLASQSPVREQLLANAGLAFKTSSALTDEREIEAQVLRDGGTPASVAEALAGHKALVVSGSFPRAVIIGADQTLSLDGTLFHKPATRDQARAQLDRLRGQTHQLYSGAALVRDGQVLWSHVALATLTMRAFSPAERDRVLEIEGDAVLLSVGAYRLEGPAVTLFESIEGDYFSILGLPLLPLLAALRRFAPEDFR